MTAGLSIIFSRRAKLNARGRAALLALLGWAIAAPVPAEPRLPAPLGDDDFIAVDPTQARLGQLLFYDRILSGNRNIACATCHHPAFGTSDGLSLPVGEGGEGLGPERTVGRGAAMIEQRVPRNSQALYNLGAKQYTRLFHDGRVALDENDPTGFNTPAEEDLPPGLASVLAAQALFPLTSAVEMAGEFGDNEVANAANRAHEHAWPVLARRLRAIPEYRRLFREAFADIDSAAEITIVHAANALAAFQASEFRADDSPFDRFLRGDRGALDDRQLAGMALFYGAAGCADCHAGALQTDHGFHAIAMPQPGWVRTRPFDSVARDQGRINESDRAEDRYRFRTPSLRNVAHTAPYGHSGAYPDLESVIRHHLDPPAALARYDLALAILPAHPVQSALDGIVMQNRREVDAMLRANELAPRPLDAAQVARLIDFLHALTDESSLRGRLGVPDAVPSGLPVDAPPANRLSRLEDAPR